MAEFDEDYAAWRSYIQSPSPQGREKLIARYAQLARMHAARLYANRQIPHIDFEEFHQYALVGLLEAVDRYDPERGATFPTYASHRIRGAILSGIEKYCEKQEQITTRTRLREERFHGLLKEFAEHEQDPFARLVNLAIGTAIGYMLDDSPMYQAEDSAYEHNIYRSRELKDLSRILESIVNTLSDSEQRVIREHYFQHVRFDEIAVKMSLSKGRISQIHHQALRRMHEHYDQLQLHRTDF